MCLSKGKLLPVSCYFLSLCVLILHAQTLSVEELKEACGFKMSPGINSTRNLLSETKFMACESVSCLPSSFTWLDHKGKCKSLGQVASQLKCGSCWAVAAAAVISDHHCLQTNEQRIFSAKHIAGCAISDGCSGGDPKVAMEYYVERGVVTGGYLTIREQQRGCVPYIVEKNLHLSCEKTCESDYSVPFDSDKRRGLSHYTITSQNVNEIKLDLMRGPLVATMEVFDDFGHYKNGIYKHSPDSKSVDNHAVRLVGWGEEGGIPYWICANSFGENWGENGFFRILAGQNECRIEEYLVGVETANIVPAPMETSITTTTQSNTIPINIPTTPISSSIPLAICKTSGNTQISGALIRHNTGNIIGDFNTVCIQNETPLTDADIIGRNNILCTNKYGLNHGLSNQYCNTINPSRFNCDNNGFNACKACDIDSNFEHCPPLTLSATVSDFVKSASAILKVVCESSHLDTHDAIIRINTDILIGNRNLICYNSGLISGFDNIICRNDGIVENHHYNDICHLSEKNILQSFRCQVVERFCQICDSHLVFEDC